MEKPYAIIKGKYVSTGRVYEIIQEKEGDTWLKLKKDNNSMGFISLFEIAYLRE